MQRFSAAETEALLPYGALAHALRDVLRASAASAPPRQAVPLPKQATLLLMPASDDRLGIVKLVTVHPHNLERGLPSIQGEVLVFDAATGRRLYLLDGAAVTARRTAALSLLAARMLAPRPEGPLLVVGAGVQGRAHLEAFASELPISQIFVVSRTAAHAEALAAHGRKLGVDAQAIADPAAVLSEATLIVTATSSQRPVLPPAVRSDSFIAAVGAYRHDMAELPAALIAGSAVVVDTVAGAQYEAGDLIQANVEWARVASLAPNHERPEHGQPVVFKSVGHALWDLAAARLIDSQLREGAAGS